ncbi:MAG TPA: TonB-dependent receptor [Longimicrobiales bacterium]|nr:TonB-dependent receptor [Longimicrobiales bacterium]
MSWRRVSALLLALLCAPHFLAAQGTTGTITGTVTSADTRAPVVGVNVFVVGTNRASISGADGKYIITGVSPGTRTVRAASIGYATREQTVTVGAGSSQAVNFTLVAEAVELKEIVAVGYGSQRARDVTGAVSSVTTEALETAPVQSIDQLLQGTAPGVQVTTGSAEPGGALSIRIRGTSSITGNSEPLYVIDGFPIENDIEGSAAGSGGRNRVTPPNPLITINPSDIESISILKDASATAIYGARGANGVVIITTKQGRGSKPQLSFDYYTGWAKVTRKYDMLNSTEFMDYANEYVVSGATSRQDTLSAAQLRALQPFNDTIRAKVVASGLNTDWQDQIFRTAPVKNAQLTVRGAAGSNSITRYSLSAGVYDQDGIVVGSGIKRFSTRLNLNQAIGQRLELGGSFTASMARSKSVPTGGQQNGGAGAVSAAIQYVPVLGVKDSLGNYSNLFTDLTSLVGSQILNAAPVPNPVALALEVLDSLSDTRLLGNVFARAELLPGLEGRVSFGGDYANRWRRTYYNRQTLQGQQTGGDALRASNGTTSWLNENTLTYKRQFNKIHDLTILAGYTQQATTSDRENMENTTFVNDITGFFSIGSGTQAGGPSVSSGHTEQILQSYLGRVNYSLKDRYLFTLTYRTDGSSRFAAAHKWGAFPSAAVAWRVSDEPFFSGLKDNVSDLKVRLSYGEVGNPSIRPYQSLSRLSSQGYSFGGQAQGGYYPSAVGNPDLTWETTTQSDFGVDVAFLKRFTLTADVYNKKTRDLLLLITLPEESGFSSALANRGSISNKGIELGLDARILNNKNSLQWRANFNYAKNRNKVLDLGGEQEIFAQTISTDFNMPGSAIRVGYPLNQFYGFQALRVVRDAADSASIGWTNFTSQAFRPGDVLLADIAGRDSLGNLVMTPDGKVTLDDRTYLGDPTPKFTLGLTNTFTYKSLELTGLLQGSYGGKILNVNRIRTDAEPRVNISRDRWENRWTPTNTNTDVPRIGVNPNTVNANAQITSNLLEDGSYLRLRTLTLSWLVPQSVQNRLRMSASRVYITGTNLFTATNYSGFDPDVSAQSVGNSNRGIDIGAYPLSRTITLGASFNF